MKAGLEMAGGVAAVIPESLDVIDGDNTMKEALELSGFPPSCIRNDDAIQSLRAARAQATQQQVDINNVISAGKAMEGAGKKPEAGSPLSAMMGEGE